MSLHFFESEIRLPGGVIVLPVRSTVVKTSQGLVVISPIKFTEAQIREIESLGTVTDLVAPSLLHHLWLPRAIRHFKTATVWGPVGCQEKLPSIKWNKVLGHDDWKFKDELECHLIEGAPRMNEVAFLEKQTNTLILTDFVFHLTNPKGWGAPVLFRLLGTYKRFALSRLVNKYIVDRAAVEKSFQKILQWNFDNLVMGHGTIVSTEAKAKLLTALKERGFC